MGLTLDDCLKVLEGIVFHPAAPLLLLCASICFQAGAWLKEPEQNLSVLGLICNLSIQTRIALSWAIFFWALQWSRIQSRKSLNPAPALSCNWPKELVVVTGGAGGIGGELVTQLEALGATVAILDVDLPSFKTGSRTHYYRTDVASFKNVTQTYNDIVAKLGSPTILAINAAVLRGNTILDATEEDLRSTFAVNVLGALFCIKAFLPSMIAAKHGHILVTSSVEAFITTSNAVDYSASKAAVTNIVEGLRTELKHKYGNPRVKVSAIFPAVVNTKMTKGIRKTIDSSIMPVLEPTQVAERMLQVMLSGQSQNVFMPAISNVSRWLQAMPDWIRIGIQDVGAHAMDHISKQDDSMAGVKQIAGGKLGNWGSLSSYSGL